MKKWILTPLFVLAVGAALSGCSMKTADTMNPTAAPATAKPMATMAPVATMEPMQSPDTTGSATAGNEMADGATAAPQGGMSADTVPAMTPAEAGRLAERISEAAERLSEVDDAEVVLDGKRVLVGVEFDDQYSAGLDERMKRMITEAVQEVDKNLTDVRITDDGTLYGQVKGLAGRLAKATGLDELANDFGDLWNRVTDM